jgi:hypothetical protein
MDDLILPLDAFVRAVGVNRNSPHAFFLGAGASVSSGIPSAWTCIWEWKRSIFLTNNPGLEDQFGELSLPSVRQRIQRWLNDKGCYPCEDSAEEYSFYIERCFPIAEDRRRYFQEKVRAAKPHVGYQLLCLLAEAEIIRSAWTTNFDGLVARAAGAFPLTPIEVGIDCQQRVPRQPSKGEILCVSLHGDYRYDPLKNTEQELQDQEATLQKALGDYLEDTSLIVCGYSGRDASVMKALTEAYSKRGPGTLYWCGYGSDVTSSVENLVRAARANGRTATFVPAQGFDDLVTRLGRHCLTDAKLDKARTIIAGAAAELKLQWEPFRLDTVPITGLIKSNAFDVECPSEVFQFDLKEWPEERRWKWLGNLTAGTQVLAVPFRKKVVALGLLDEVKTVFGDNIQGPIERSPVTDDDTRYEDGAVMSLLRRALICSLAAKTGIATDGENRLWEKQHFDKKTASGQEYRIHRAVIVYLRRYAGRILLILKPSLAVFDISGNEAPREVGNPIKLEILGWQHNKPFNQEMQRWRQRLLPDKPQTIIEYPNESGSTFRFRIRQAPIFAGIGNPKHSRIQISDNFRPHIKQSGLELPEPNLRFANKAGSGYVTDPHPIRGLVRNRPYDFRLSQTGLSSAISVGVVCPRIESNLLEPYLHRCDVLHRPQKTEQDYLLDYPGFSSAFGLPLGIPGIGTDSWAICPELDAGLSERDGCLELARRITQAVSSLDATRKPNIILIFVPTRWRKWTRFAADGEQFDLHDFVKAYCVQRGIATQFLEQDTLEHQQQCRVWWWLSLALYAKAMRTPWVLDGLDRDTAFVGLGFSIDRGAEVGQHIVLGCGHLYNSQGEGLQYRLSKIENPVIIRGNPFMSRDDARHVGETIRQLFFDAHSQLPRRVVIHKLTRFRRDEREGLQEGLSGVAEVDMLEINGENALRYVASVARREGGFDEDNFPVRRGTIVQLDEHAALLWVHGVTDAVKPSWKYYQGKRRIPAPVVIRRHAGKSDLSLVAREILGLSKMDWNSADMYSKLPATVYSSKQIARIGNLLRGFGPMSYDYRLFI